MGQTNNITDTDLIQIAKNIRGSGIYARSIDKYEGTPFLSDWTKGYLILSNGAKGNVMRIRYNMENNHIQFMRNNKAYAIAGNKLKGFILLKKDSQVFFRNGFKASDKDIEFSTLLRIIVDGKIKLLAHHSSELKEETAYGYAGKVYEFVEDVDYYLVTGNGKFHETDLEKDDILEILPGENKKIKEFAEKFKLDYEKEKDLARILSYYNMILSSDVK